MQHYTNMRDLVAKNPGQYAVTYESLADVVAAGRGDCDLDLEKRESSTMGNATWYHTATIKEARDLALSGWTEGVDRIVDLAERINEKVSRRMPAHGMDLWEEGGEVDVASYLDGQRACMWTWAEQDNKRPVIRVTMNISATSSTTPNQYIFAGALAAALVDALENSGRRVELDALCSIESSLKSGYFFTFVTKLKNPEQQLDMGAVAFALAHPSMLRRIVFAAWETAPIKAVETFGFRRGLSYGRVRSSPEELRGEVHLDLNTASRMSIEEGYDWIIEHLRSQGVDVQ
jgi:hypothetical protein